MTGDRNASLLAVADAVMESHDYAWETFRPDNGRPLAPESMERSRIALRDAIYDALASSSASGAAWLPIETAPKDGTRIDLWGTPHGRIVDVSWGPVRDWAGNEREDWQHGKGKDYTPTHWQPLPPPPQADGGPDA